MSYDSSNHPYYLEQLPASEQQWLDGMALDMEFMTTEDKIVINNLRAKYGLDRPSDVPRIDVSKEYWSYHPDFTHPF